MIKFEEDEDTIPLCIAYDFIEIFPDECEKVMAVKELKKRGYSLDDIVAGLLEIMEIREKEYLNAFDDFIGDVIRRI